MEGLEIDGYQTAPPSFTPPSTPLPRSSFPLAIKATE